MTSQQKIDTDRPNPWLDHVAQNQRINGQLQVESLRKFHYTLMGLLTSWFNFEEPIDDLLDLTVLEARKRGPALKIRLVGNAQWIFPSRISESRRWS